jgi:secondary thiamine-phosphate synthase enzyme
VLTRLVTVTTSDREVVLDLTGRCEEFLREVEAGDGLLHVFVPHATAGVAVLETGAGSGEDLLTALGDLLPRSGPGGGGWRHRHGSVGHGRDHVVPALVAPFAVVPVVRGGLALGTWQSIALVDTNVDNPHRTVRLSFLDSA